MKDKNYVPLEQIDIAPIGKLQAIIDASKDVNYLYRVRGLLYARTDLTSTQYDYWEIQISRKINRISFDSSTSKYFDPLGR